MRLLSSCLVVLLGCLFCGGCRSVCASIDGSCLELYVDGQGQFAAVRVELTFGSGPTQQPLQSNQVTEVSLPLRMRVVPPQGVMTASVHGIEVVAEDAGGKQLTVGYVPVEWVDGEHIEASVSLPPQPVFERRDIQVGTGPGALVAEDFNLDGIPDLAVVNTDADSVSMLLGNGDGSFRMGNLLKTGSGPTAVVSGDFYSDGKPSLAIVTIAAGQVSVFRGNGDGSFATSVNSMPLPRAEPMSILRADVNGDGKLDLGVGYRSQTAVTFVMNTGGTFGILDTPLASAPGPVAVFALTDKDGDSKPDMILNYENTKRIDVYRGISSTTIAETYTALNNVSSIILDDLDRDGKKDIAVVLPGQSAVETLLGAAPGIPGTVAVPQVSNSPTAMISQDVNGDSHPELITISGGSNSIGVLLGRADGRFLLPQNFDTGNEPSAVVAVDFDRDGRMDLAVTNYANNSLTILLNRS